MKEQIPVNPAVLKWARITIGLTEAVVAHKIGKSEDLIKEWESGKSAPTYPVLERLAYNIYKRPVAVFFFPLVPQEEGPKTDFRTLPDEIIKTLPPEIIKIYRKVKVFQINLSELYDDKKPVEISLFDNYRLSFSTDIKALSKDLRRELQIDIEKQIQWNSYDTAFEEWRNALVKRGVFVFKDAFHDDFFSGLCLYDEKYPVIFINNSMPHSRQIFTIFHELAHLLYKSGGVDVPSKSFFRQLSGDYSNLEVKCNQFAGEFLLPDSVLNVKNLRVDEDFISELALRYKVSREVVLRKYLNFELIDEKSYNRFADKWKEEYIKLKGKKSAGGQYYYTQKVYLGENYINLVFSKYFQNKISTEGLADYLGIKVKNISTFESYVLR